MNIIQSIRVVLENSSLVSSLNNMAGKSKPVAPIFPKSQSPTPAPKVSNIIDPEHKQSTSIKVAGLVGKNTKKLFQVDTW